MFSLSKNYNINYLAKVVKINNLRKHSNADRLQCTSIDGCNVIVGLEQKIGDYGIFFPIESQIAGDFLSANNLFKDKTTNSNQSKVGFFEQNGRVKALKLRGEKSEGFWIPIDALNHPPYGIDYNTCVVHEGKDFDTVDGRLLVQKYRIKYSNVKKDPADKKAKKAAKPESILVDNQFHFHIDTPQLGRNLFKFRADSFISITQKLHGTSFISSKVLTKRKLSLKERVARWIGCRVEETEYKNLYASRRVIKNIGSNKGSYYSEDIWGYANQQVEPHLRDGMTVYGEIVGYLPSGLAIQKHYDYGCSEGRHQVYVYRITWTLPNGHVVDWSWGQIKEWCRFHGLLHVPEFFRGSVQQYLEGNGANVTSFLGDDFLSSLQKVFLEKKGSMLHPMAIKCKNDVWDEGIVVRIEDSSDFDVFKLKSFNFREAESKQLDSGEVDLESQAADEAEMMSPDDSA